MISSVLTASFKGPTIMVSGGFDPIHVGHIELLRDASAHGSVIVALNSDRWLRRKKKYCFMSWADRHAILLAMRWVSAVVEVDDDDGTVRSALHQYNPTFFGNGGDRSAENTPEMYVCEQLGIECVWDLGGVKTRGSTPTFENAVRELYGDDALKELFG